VDCAFLVFQPRASTQNAKLCAEEHSLIVMLLQSVYVLSVLFLVVYLVRHYVFTFAVIRQSKKISVSDEAFSEIPFEPTVTILIPAQNEGQVIGLLLQRMTELTYPKDKLQVIVIDDASSDNTGKVADTYSEKYPFIEVLHRSLEIGGKGKAAAMNAGLARSTGEIVLCFDADYSPQKDIVEKLVKPFVDPSVGAVQGRPVVLNEPTNMVTR
jgi:cellulose synthase/poly-beta-1,6-N-acetylglucosamine synthase-like glycosyltransferase